MTTTPTGAPARTTTPLPAESGVPRSVLVLPSGELHASGVRTAIEPDPATATAGAEAAAVVARLRAGGVTEPVVLGVLGPDGPRLAVPASSGWRPPRTPAGPAAARDARAAGWDVRPDPLPARYAAAVHRALELTGGSGTRGVVLARALDLVAPGPVDAAEVLAHLVGPDVPAYLVDPADGGSALVGLGEELLVARRGDHVVSAPVAGTAERGADPDEDVRRGRALAASADLTAHAAAVARLVERLGPWCDHLDVPAGPELVATSRRWQLVTRIEGRLRVPRPTALELAEALRPPAAVWGDPAAVERTSTGHVGGPDRVDPSPGGHLGTPVGWCDADGDGEWVLAAPCAEIRGRHVRLLAGAVVAPGCRPEAELARTGATFRTLLAAVGLGSTP